MGRSAASSALLCAQSVQANVAALVPTHPAVRLRCARDPGADVGGDEPAQRQRRFATTSSRIGGAPSSLPRRPARRKAAPTGAAHDQYGASQREHRRAEDGAHVGVVHLLPGGLRVCVRVCVCVCAPRTVRLRSLATSVRTHTHMVRRLQSCLVCPPTLCDLCRTQSLVGGI